MPLETALTFILASALLAFAPGPDNIFVLTQSATHGWRAGVLVTLGLCTGLIVHTMAVALGVAAIFQVSAVAFTGLKILGAVYLLYLAWQAFKAGAMSMEDQKSAPLSAKALYLRGVVMNLTNPKVAIFFLAFLPQFTQVGGLPISLQMVILGLLFIATALVVFSSIAILSGLLRRWFARSQHGQAWLNRIASVVFVGLAIKLLSSQRA